MQQHLKQINKGFRCNLVEPSRRCRMLKQAVSKQYLPHSKVRIGPAQALLVLCSLSALSIR